MLLVQEFDFEVKDQNGYDNMIADHLSRLENEVKNLDKMEIDDSSSNE